MTRHELHIGYTICTFNELDAADQGLIGAAREALPLSYSPYSQFKVACALLLNNGQMITGVNIENAAYPACICAERAAVSTLLSQYPGRKVKMICIAAQGSEENESRGFTAPCGECRQVIFELVSQYGELVKLILYQSAQRILIMENVTQLLPFGFGREHLNHQS